MPRRRRWLTDFCILRSRVLDAVQLTDFGREEGAAGLSKPRVIAAAVHDRAIDAALVTEKLELCHLAGYAL